MPIKAPLSGFRIQERAFSYASGELTEYSALFLSFPWDVRTNGQMGA